MSELSEARAKSASSKGVSENKKQASARIRPVKIESEPAQTPTCQPSVRSPSGTVVVGLSTVDIAAFERALSLVFGILRSSVCAA
ncbi:MAG: hypothetical protein GY811_25870 [Myxococcales bacterium]|nr:hypothetical protein [Myxococcales bacterium]